MTPGGFSLSGVANDDEERGSELTPGEKPTGGGRGPGCGDRLRSLVIADRDLGLGSSDEMHAEAFGVSAFYSFLRTVVEAECRAGGKEVWQTRQCFKGELLGGLEQMLLGGPVWWRVGGEFSCGRIEEGGAVREEQ